MSCSDIIQLVIAGVTFLGVIVALCTTGRSLHQQNKLSLFEKRCANYETIFFAVGNFKNIKDKMYIDKQSFNNSRIPGILEFIGHISFDGFSTTLLRNDLTSDKNKSLVLEYTASLDAASLEVELLFQQYGKEVSEFLNDYAKLIKTLYDYETMLIEDRKNNNITPKTAKAFNDFVSLGELFKNVESSYVKLVEKEILVKMKKEIL